MNKPTFIGIGGQKCASTWLSECLRSHPDIQMSTPKELRYFTDNRPKGLDWYLSFFPNQKGVIHRGEFSSNYIYEPDLPEKIYNEIGAVKIIAVVRAPSERLLSHVKHLIRDGDLAPLDGVISRADLVRFIDEFPKLVTNSKYFDGLSAYKKLFGKPNVFYVSQAACRTNPNLVLSSLWEFLGVAKGIEIPELNRTVSVGIIPRSHHLETLRKGLYSIAKARLPSAINIVRKTGLSRAYRKFNKGNEIELSSEAREYINKLCETDWEKTKELLTHT